MKIKRSLFLQIAVLYLLLIVFFSALVAAFTVSQVDAFLDELGQSVNRELAGNLAKELEPVLSAGLQTAEAKAATTNLRELNPGMELYVLDSSGLIVASYTHQQPATDTRIDLQPLDRFLKKTTALPIYSLDPIDEGRLKIFSVARISLPDQSNGYLFVILHGMSFQAMADMVRDSYIVRGVVAGLSLILLTTLVVGIALFALLTRRFRRLTETVENIRDGDFDKRIEVETDDEIGRLGRAVNHMAEMIQAQIEVLRRTDDERRLLVAKLSHDFRTPLTSMQGYTQRLLKNWERIQPEERIESLNAILGNSIRLEHMTGQLATLSQLDIHVENVQLEAFSLRELVQDVVINFRPVAEKRNIRIDSHYPVLPDVMGDIGLIDRALSNLLDNAIRFSFAGGHIEVDTVLIGDSVVVSISDKGCGIAKDEVQLVTQRFYRTARGQAIEPVGSGLGLAIASEILQRHGSKLEISSAQDVGTIVSFKLAVVL